MNKNKVLKQGRLLFNTDNDGLTRIAGAFYASLDTEAVPTDVEGAGLGTKLMNATRRVMKRKYNIPNLRELTDKDGLTQLPYSNFIGPGTDLESALKAGPVTAGPAGEDKSINGLSHDAVAKQHDLLYYNAESLPENEKFNAIQAADKWMIDEVETMPDSKTKSLILKALKVKYAAEKARGKLIYGGKIKFKPLGGQWRQTDKKEFLSDNIEAIIEGNVRTGTFNKKIKTRSDVIAENLKLKKEQDDEETARKIEKQKPFGRADKSVLGLDEKLYKQFQKVDYDTKDMVYRSVVFFKKDDKIPEENRPRKEWKEMDPITDPSTGDIYIYTFCLHKLDDANESFGIDNTDFIIYNDEGKYITRLEDENLLTALGKLSKDVYDFSDNELLDLNKYGFIDNEGFINYQIDDKYLEEVNVYETNTKPVIKKNKRINIKRVFESIPARPAEPINIHGLDDDDGFQDAAEVLDKEKAARTEALTNFLDSIERVLFFDLTKTGDKATRREELKVLLASIEKIKELGRNDKIFNNIFKPIIYYKDNGVMYVENTSTIGSRAKTVRDSVIPKLENFLNI